MFRDGWSPVQRVGPNLRVRHGRHPAVVVVVAPVWTPGSLWPVCFDDIFDGPPADGAARIDLSLELEPAVVAQTHVAAGVDDGVHLLVEANGAFSVLASRGQLRARGGWGGGRTEWGAGGRHCKIKEDYEDSSERSDDGFHVAPVKRSEITSLFSFRFEFFIFLCKNWTQSHMDIFLYFYCNFLYFYTYIAAIYIYLH